MTPHPTTDDAFRADGGEDRSGLRQPRRQRKTARAATPGPAMLVRGALTLACLALAALGLLNLPALADAPLRLRGDVTARGDVLTLSDLAEGAVEPAASRPLFRAPALGATGTIQARRIVEAAAGLGLAMETGGRSQVSVQRATRRVGATEIEAALKRGLETVAGLAPTSLAIRLDGEAPVLLAPVDLTGAVQALDLTYDPRSRRLAALVSLGERQASLRVSGAVVELRDVAILTRALVRGEAVREADVVLERRPREGLPADGLSSTGGLVGEVAQRALPAGSALRAGDTAPPDLVARGETVTIVYEQPGISLSMRGVANEAGRMGATIPVVNAASKKVLQASVVGPGRVSVGPLLPQRQASATPNPTLR